MVKAMLRDETLRPLIGRGNPTFQITHDRGIFCSTVVIPYHDGVEASEFKVLLSN